MEIGTIIRTARRAKDMTQEELAEILSLSVSAVSSWECGKNLPDITAIPALCSVLEISADTLLGIDETKKKEQIEKIVEEAGRFGNRGYLDRAEEILTEGLRKYPDSWSIMAQLMHNHFNKYCVNHLHAADLDKTILYGERILDKCTEDGYRQNAIQILTYAYDRKGDKEKAKQIAGLSAGIYVSRDVLLAGILDGQEGLAHNRYFIGTLFDLLTSHMTKSYTLDTGEERFTPAEMAQVYEKIPALYGLMFENGDYGFYHTRLYDAHAWLARYYADTRNRDATLTHLTKMAYHAAAFVEYVESETYECTSLLFREKTNTGFSTNSSENNAQVALEILRQERYDFVRDTAEFCEIRTMLEARAGKWEPKE